MLFVAQKSYIDACPDENTLYKIQREFIIVYIFLYFFPVSGCEFLLMRFPVGSTCFFLISKVLLVMRVEEAEEQNYVLLLFVDTAGADLPSCCFFSPLPMFLQHKWAHSCGRFVLYRFWFIHWELYSLHVFIILNLFTHKADLSGHIIFWSFDIQLWCSQVILYSGDRAYDDYYQPMKGRVHFNSADPKTGDASINLTGLKSSDSGTYQCKVKKAPGIRSRKMLLIVMGEWHKSSSAYHNAALGFVLQRACIIK